jgi:hypothetical protein
MRVKLIIVQRGRDHETDILAVFEEVASEIPVRLDGEERQRKIQTEIMQCRQAGKSWVAVDTRGKVVGFVLRSHSEMRTIGNLRVICRWNEAGALVVEVAGALVVEVAGGRRRAAFSTAGTSAAATSAVVISAARTSASATSADT